MPCGNIAVTLATPSKGVTTLLPTFMSRISTKPFGVRTLLSSGCCFPAASIPLSSFAHLRSSSPWITTYQVHLLFRPLFPLFPSLIPIRRSFRLYGISLHFLGLFLVLSFLYFSSTCILQCSLKPLLLSAIRQYPLLSPRSESTVHLRIGVFTSSMSFCELKRMD